MGGEQHAQVTTIGSRPSNKYDEQNRQVQQEIHDSLILDLQDKERAIQQGKAVHAWTSNCRLMPTTSVDDCSAMRIRKH